MQAATPEERAGAEAVLVNRAFAEVSLDDPSAAARLLDILEAACLQLRRLTGRASRGGSRWLCDGVAGGLLADRLSGQVNCCCWPVYFAGEGCVSVVVVLWQECGRPPDGRSLREGG